MNDMAALLACSLAITSACAAAAPIDTEPAESSPATASAPVASSTAPSNATAMPTAAASAGVAEADCSKEPWPVFTPANLAGAPSPNTGAAPAQGPTARPLAKPSTSGGVPGAAEVIATMAPDFRKCFQRQLCDDPQAAGKVRVTAKIDPLGQVTETTSELDGAIGEQGIACLESVMKSKLFSPPEGGAATLVVPLNFTTAM